MLGVSDPCISRFLRAIRASARSRSVDSRFKRDSTVDSEGVGSGAGCELDFDFPGERVEGRDLEGRGNKRD